MASVPHTDSHRHRAARTSFWTPTRRRWAIGLLVIVVLLVAIRLLLPSVVLSQVNQSLARLDSYHGHVESVHLALWRGAYRVEGVTIVKKEADTEVPFFSADSVAFSVEWRQLLRGALVAEAQFYRPQLNFVQAKSEQQSQVGKEENWAKQLQGLFPFRFNTVRVHDGTITFKAPGIRTQDAITAHQLNATLSNLTNTVDAEHDAFATFDVRGSVLGDAPLYVQGRVNPLESQPTFDVNLSVEQVKLPKVNPWLQEYIKADAASGDFQLYMEIAAADGKFKGYAKPIMQNVELASTEDRNDTALRKLWEGLVDFAAKVFENDDEEQVAARVPFSGTIDNPETSLLETIVSVVRNAFVGAFAQSLEGSISLRDVKENLGEYNDEE